MSKAAMTPIGKGRMTNPRGAIPLVSLLTFSLYKIDEWGGC